MVTYLSVLCRFDFYERRICKLRESSSDLRLTRTSRSDHQDILRTYFFSEVFAEELSTPSVSVSDSYSSFRLFLSDNMRGKVLNDFTRRHTTTRSSRRSRGEGGSTEWSEQTPRAAHGLTKAVHWLKLVVVIPHV